MTAYLVIAGMILAFGLGLLLGTVLSLRLKSKSLMNDYEDIGPWTKPSMPPEVIEPGDEPTVAEEIAKYLPVQEEWPVVLNGRHRREVMRYLRDRNREVMNAIGRPVG